MKTIVLSISLFFISIFSFCQTPDKHHNHLFFSAGVLSSFFSKDNLGNETIEMHLTSKFDYGIKLGYSHSLFKGKSNIDISVGMTTSSFSAKYNFIVPTDPDDNEIIAFHNVQIYKPLIGFGFSVKSFSKKNITIVHTIGAQYQYNSLKHLYSYKLSSSLNNNYTVYINDITNKGIKYDIFNIKSMFRSQFYLMLGTSIHYTLENNKYDFMIHPHILTNFDFLNDSPVVSSYKFTLGLSFGLTYKIKNKKNET